VKGVGRTLQARQLGRHLKELRKEAGVSVEHAADELGVSEPTIYRFEAGTSVPRPPDVTALCAMYGVDQGFTEALVSLVKEANAPGWWRSYNGAIPRWFDTFVSLESAAVRIQAYETDVILGLLQTERYAETLIALGASAVDGAGDLARRVEVRLRRQRILDRRNAPKLDVILGEAALMRSPDPAVMAEQMAHLDELSQRPNISVRVFPLNVLHRSVDCGSRFTILTFAKDRRGSAEPPVVFTDNLTGAAYLDKPEDHEAYTSVWDDAWQVALDPAASGKVINEYRERYETR